MSYLYRRVVYIIKLLSQWHGSSFKQSLKGIGIIIITVLRIGIIIILLYKLRNGGTPPEFRTEMKHAHSQRY